MNLNRALELVKEYDGVFKTQYVGNFCLIDYFYKDRETFMDSPETREFRGIVFDVRDGSIASRPFHVFWNHGEVPETRDLRLSGMYAEKRDGSMAQISYHKGEFIIASRSSLSGYVHDSVSAYTSKYLPGVLEYAQRHPEYTFLFEFEDRENPIVLMHERTQLVFLAARHKETGLYADFSGDLHMGMGALSDGSVSYTRFDSEDEVDRVVSEYNQERKEGLILWVDGYGILKKKTPWYVESHGYVTTYRAWNWVHLYSQGLYDDVAAQLYSLGHKERVEEADEVVRKFSNLVSERVVTAYSNIQSTPKETALLLQDLLAKDTLSKLVFSATLKACRESLPMSKIMSMVLEAVTESRAKSIVKELNI